MEPIPRVIPAPVLAPLDAPPSIASLTRGNKPDSTDPDHAYLHDLIAHYLSTHYPAALPAFMSASGASDPSTLPPPNPDLRTLVADAASAVRAAALTSSLDALALAPEQMSVEKLIQLPLPPSDTLHDVVRTVPLAASNLLAVAVADVPFRRFDTSTAEYVAGHRRCAIVSGADREVRVMDYDSGEVTALLTHKSPVLTVAVHPTQPRYLVTGSMDGSTTITDLITSAVVQKFTSAKFVVRVAFSPDGKYMAVASYDHTITVYEAEESAVQPEEVIDDNDDPILAAEPSLRYALKHTVKTEHNPEALLFHPRTEWLMYTVRASHVLHYLRLPTAALSTSTLASDTEVWSTRTKSFNPHPMDSHVSFAVLDLALHPSGRAIACITGDHAGTSGERVLVYGVEPDETARLACIWTGSDSDPFVLPRVAWLPCGRGVITSSATGHLALLSTTGEVRSRIQVHSAQGPGTSDVVRDIVVVPVGETGWEVMSVGYDRCVRVTRGRD